MLSDDITYWSRKHAGKIKRNTDLLFQQFGITYFTFQKITNEGEWGLITSVPDWHAHSVDNLYYNYDPSLVDPRNYKSGTCFTSSHSNKQTQVILKDAFTFFNLDHCLAIIERTAEGCEFALFATFPENKQIINAYINKLHKLRAFVNFFKTENETLLKYSEESQVSLKKLRSDFSENNNNILDISTFNENDLAQIDKLTQREQQCLSYLLEGKTAKEIAKTLGLSPRTIEDYIVNLRVKLDCKDKQALIALFKDSF